MFSIGETPILSWDLFFNLPDLFSIILPSVSYHLSVSLERPVSSVSVGIYNRCFVVKKNTKGNSTLR